jgi:glycosyltransferase involved in cell wall biosynthesis
MPQSKHIAHGPAEGRCVTDSPDISVVIPAFNEERYLGATLDAIVASCEHLRRLRGETVEIIVVDNGSADGTAAIAREHGAMVVSEPDRGIGKARNAGAARATARVLIFVDADTVVPRDFLGEVCRTMDDSRCVAGAMDAAYRPQRRSMQLYLAGWRLFGRLTRMAQGAAQFCLRDAFVAVHGYDEGLFMGEDVDFFWRLERYAKTTGCFTRIRRDTRVVPSTRRFDRWPLWRVLLMTNPVVILLLRRRRSAWSGWYERAVR